MANLTNQPNLNPSPKQRFMQSPDNISKHRELVESREFQRALDYATLEYQLLLAREVQANPQMAGGQGFKLTGATEFTAVLRTLSEMPRLDRVIPQDNLQHKA